MATPWKWLPGDVPEDGATVWIRLRPWCPAYTAEWELATQSFVGPGTLVVPWYEVSKWKPV